MAIFNPLTALKDTAGICEFCLQNHKPNFITRNGTPELVIMSADFFNNHFRSRNENHIILIANFSCRWLLKIFPLFGMPKGGEGAQSILYFVRKYLPKC